MSVHEIRHPLVRHKIDLLREAETGPKLFRELSAELATLLTYEALHDLATERKTIQGWAGAVEADHLRVDLLTVVPVVRAGLGLLPGVLQILPHIEVSLVGLYRNEETLDPVPYFEKLVDRLHERTALIIDPMLGTGGTCSATVDILKKAGCRSIRAICLVAVPEGLTRLASTHPDVDVYTAAVDDRLNDIGYIVPGLGDAGDRIFGTPHGG